MSKDATIIRSQNFETSIVNIQEHCYAELSSIESTEWSSMKQDCVEVENRVEYNISIAEMTINKKGTMNETTIAFLDTLLILPASKNMRAFIPYRSLFSWG